MPIFPNASGTNIREGATFSDIGRDQINYYTSRGDEPVLHTLLNPVDDAAYDRSNRTGPVARCYPGTREGVITKIVQSAGDRPICWLSGPAGSGKSAISQTIAERYAAKKRLAASFFFFRGAGDRSKITRFIPTLAYQLSLSVPSAKPLIECVLQNEPFITTNQSLRYQFQKLIVEPFIKTNKSLLPYLPWRKPMVIILDGLDECDDRDAMAEFIGSLIDVLREIGRLRLWFFITSRIEEHIRKKLDINAARGLVHRLSLQEFDARIDIRQFFRSRFSTIYEENTRLMRNVRRPWPSESDLDSLVKKADELFIFAVTLMNFMEQGGGLPQENLQKALAAEAGLDELYKQVLWNAPRNDDFKRIIGTLVLLSSPLSITFIAQLLQLRPEKIVEVLLGTQSILMIPEDDNEPIRLIHTSLRDLLASQPRSGDFFIDPPTRNFSIATDCLTLMAMWPEGIFYEGAQEYACLNWCHHICESLVNCDLKPLSEAALMRLLKDFVLRSLYFWVNTMLLNECKMSDALDLVLTLPNCPQGSMQMMQDIKVYVELEKKDFEAREDQAEFAREQENLKNLKKKQKYMICCTPPEFCC